MVQENSNWSLLWSSQTDGFFLYKREKRGKQKGNIFWVANGTPDGDDGWVGLVVVVARRRAPMINHELLLAGALTTSEQQRRYDFLFLALLLPALMLHSRDPARSFSFFVTC